MNSVGDQNDAIDKLKSDTSKKINKLGDVETKLEILKQEAKNGKFCSSLIRFIDTHEKIKASKKSTSQENQETIKMINVSTHGITNGQYRGLKSK